MCRILKPGLAIGRTVHDETLIEPWPERRLHRRLPLEPPQFALARGFAIRPLAAAGGRAWVACFARITLMDSASGRVLGRPHTPAEQRVSSLPGADFARLTPSQRIELANVLAGALDTKVRRALRQLNLGPRVSPSPH
jgi:hypothetical protein